MTVRSMPDLRPLLDTTNQQQHLLSPSSPTKRRRLSRSQLLAAGTKSPPTCTISLENVTVSSTSDCIISNSLVNCFQFPSPSTPVSLVSFPYTESDSEPELELAAPKRRRTSRSVCSYTTDCGKKRRSTPSKHRRSASVTPHTLLSPAARAPLLSSSTTTPRRFANSEVRFVAMVRSTVLSGIHVDVPMLEASSFAKEYEEIREQNAVLANRLGQFLAEKGFQQPPPQGVEASSTPSTNTSLPAVPTPTPSQLVALLILRHNDRSAVRSSKSYAARSVERRTSPLAHTA